MQYDILQYLSVYTIHILCYTHIDDVNRSFKLYYVQDIGLQF